MNFKELDILHRLFKLDKDYKKSFEILLKMNSQSVFDYFDG